jgi:hypothetical protein
LRLADEIERQMRRAYDQENELAHERELAKIRQAPAVVALKGPPVKATSLKFRSDLNKAILAQLINNPEATDLEICRCVDADDAPKLPPSLKKSDQERSLEDAYKDPHRRARVHDVISKVRRRMRKKGLLA